MSTFNIAVQIGASLTSGFSSALRSSSNQLNQLGSSLDKLKRQQAAIRRIEISEGNVGQARVAYNAAVGDVVRLRKEMAKVETPSKKLEQSFKRAKEKAERLSGALTQQRERLQKARQALRNTGLSTENLTADNRRLGQSVEKLNRQYSRLGKSMRAQQANKSRRAELRAQLFDATALGASVVAPLAIAVNFEQSVAKLGAITFSTELSDEANAQNKAMLEEEARRLGRETQFTASQTASAMSFLAMAGFDPDQIKGATGGVLNLAKAAGSDLAQTADISSNILSGFGLDATKDMGRVGDVLAATFTSSNTTLASLGETMKFVAPFARDAGASLEDVAAMTGLLGNVGIQGSRAGTALRATLLRLSAPTGEAAKALESLGIDVADMDGNLRPVSHLLKDISLATKEMGSVQKTGLLKKIFGEEPLSGVSELLNQVSMTQLEADLAKIAGGSKGAARLQANFDRLAEPLGNAKKQMVSLGISVADVNGELRPVPDLIKALSNVTVNMDDNQQKALLNRLFDKDDVEAVAELLTKATTNVLDGTINEAANAGGVLDRIASQMGATTLDALKRLGSALESVAISVGNTLLPTIASGAELFAKIASGVSQLASTFPLLTKAIVGTTTGLIALRVATIAGGFAYTFVKGAVLSLRTAYLALTSGIVLQKTAMVATNALSAVTAVRIGIITAAQWAWNVALTANPIGLIVVGIGALIGAGVMLIKHWDKVKSFFGSLWAGIKKMTGAAVDWLLGNLELLMGPFGLLLKAGKWVFGKLFGSDKEKPPSAKQDANSSLPIDQPSLGSAVNQSTAAPNQLATLSKAEASIVNQQTTQSTVIDAPITINASPGMDERAIALQVRQELDQRETQADARRRTQLFDAALV